MLDDGRPDVVGYACSVIRHTPWLQSDRASTSAATRVVIPDTKKRVSTAWDVTWSSGSCA